MAETIVLRAANPAKCHEEALANAALSPGHLLEVMSTGKVRKVATIDIAYPLLVAKENYFEGGLKTDAYAGDDNVPMHRALPGDRVYLRVAAGAAAIVKGDKLAASNDGTVVKSNATTDYIVAMADEAVDNSGGGSEAFIAVKAL